jgi:hypothetical protein
VNEEPPHLIPVCCPGRSDRRSTTHLSTAQGQRGQQQSQGAAQAALVNAAVGVHVQA